MAGIRHQHDIWAPRRCRIPCLGVRSIALGRAHVYQPNSMKQRRMEVIRWQTLGWWGVGGSMRGRAH